MPKELTDENQSFKLWDNVAQCFVTFEQHEIGKRTQRTEIEPTQNKSMI